MSSPANKDAVQINLVDLIATEANQIRCKLDTATVERYASAMLAGADFPPISVAFLNGAPVLFDGFHRVSAARKIGFHSIAAIVRTAHPNELRWLAADANLRHGFQLKGKERRAVFKAYVKARQCFRADGSVKSSREIASDLQGLRTHQTILTWMKEDFRSIWRRMINDEDEPRHDGGEPDTMTTDDSMKASVLDLLASVRATMRAIADPLTRGEMIAEAEAIMADMRNQRPFEACEIDF